MSVCAGPSSTLLINRTTSSRTSSLRLYNPALSPSDACNGLWIVAGTDPCGAANAQFGTNVQFRNSWTGPRAGQQQQSHDRSASWYRVGSVGRWEHGGPHRCGRVLPARARKPLHAGRTMLHLPSRPVTTPLDGGVAAAQSRCRSGRWYGSARDTFPSRSSGTSAFSAAWHEIQLSNSVTLETMLYHQTSSLRPEPDCSAELVGRVVYGERDVQAAGFFAFNNYYKCAGLVDSPGRRDLSLAAGVVQDALQAIAVDCGLYVVALDRERAPGRLFGRTSDSRASRIPTDPGLDRGNSAINRPQSSQQTSITTCPTSAT